MNAKLYVVGIGPGGSEHMTPAARAVIEKAATVVGYKTYLDLIPELLQGKSVVSSGMMREIERCRQALEIAATGQVVALVSSGDSGIYGMAGLALELEQELALAVEVEIVPGISAVQAAASRLGAPLMHDFAVVSLSDLLTPWNLIRRRLDAAGSADFVLALYNPKSKGRTTQIGEARDILLRHRPASTPVGIVRNACRPGESLTTTDLEHLPQQDIDMLSVVIIGNASTRIDGQGRMVTPRGYAIRDEAAGTRSRFSRKPGADSAQSGFSGRALFVGGTGSDVGKSVIAAGLCRILKRRGVSVAPFKAQNMALNSAVTPEGGEIGRAQALQAAACGLDPHVDMNPVLLKPNSDTGSQVIVHGRPVGNMAVTEYHRYKPQAFAAVQASFARLSQKHRVVVMEGAGSIAEINLKAQDITNLRAAEMAGAPVLLVADIDRGGVFASIVGTLSLLEPQERARVAGVIINRFRGDAGLLAPGIAEIEDRTGVPVLGVIPWLRLDLPEEDSVALTRKGKQAAAGSVRIGVVRLPRISNYTDFDPLEREPGVSLAYIDNPVQVQGLDLLILPGTKSTIPDLEFLRQTGMLEAIAAYHRGGGRIIGICGGYQMLGRRLADPLALESQQTVAEGLGLLDVHTVLQAEKTTHQVSALPLEAAGSVGLSGLKALTGYEIHAGETELGHNARPLFLITARSGQSVCLEDGALCPDGRVWGTYMHGLFDEPEVRAAVLAPLRPSFAVNGVESSAATVLDSELDRLADHLQTHLDLERILALLDLTQEHSCTTG